MKNQFFSLDTKSPNETLEIIRRIRMKTEMELNQNNSEMMNQISFQNPATKIKSPKIQPNIKPSKKHKATIFFAKGLKYQGEILNQKFDGFGIISKNQIQLYVGSFSKGSFEGFGRLMNSEEIELGVDIVFDDWIAYSGEFKEGLFHGMGTLILQNGDKFLGQFKEGNLIKQGVFHTNNKVFVGEWN